MAKNYNDIYTAVYTKNNKMDFGNSMIRGNGIPLDITEVYNSLEAAQNYVNSNPVAYEGQVIAVTENNDTTVYVIAARLAEDGVTVEHYLKEVGKTPEVDNVTIKIIDGKLTAVIPEYADTDTQYTLSVLADGKIAFASDIDGEEATEISFVGAQGITVTSNAETGVITITGPDLSGYATKTEMANKADATSVYTKTETDGLLNAKANSADVYTKTEVDDIADGLEEEIGKKANAADVYTKTEADEAIGKAVAAADHLKRKIVDSKEEIDIDAPDAMQYIYMVPSGLTASDNKYYEYIVLEDNGVKYVEQVGNWEVDLKDYLTIAAANETYAKKNEVANTYATKDEVTTALGDYATKSEVTTTLGSYATKTEVANTLEGYVTDQELSTTLSGYATKTEIPTDYVSDSEFAEEIAKYETAETAEGKYAGKTATEQALNARYTKEEVDALIGTPGTPETEGNPAVPGTGVYQNVYSKDEVTDLIADITGGESAADVKAELTAYKTSNDAAVNDLTSRVGEVETKVSSLETLLNGKADANVVATLADTVGELDTKVSSIETNLNNYVTKSEFTTAINDINDRLTWKTLG